MSNDGRFPNRIRELRAARKLSQEKVARRAKVALGTISLAERGLRRPNIVNQQKIAEALRAEREYVFPDPEAAA